MSRNARPRKAYKPRQMRTPMTAGARDELAFKFHAIISTFTHMPTAESFNDVCRYMAIAGRAVANERRYDAVPEMRDRRIKQFTSLMLTAQSIYERSERTGALTLTDHDKAAYRAAAAAMDAILGELDYSTFLIAKEQVNAEMRGRVMDTNTTTKGQNEL